MSVNMERAKALSADKDVHYNCAQSVLIPFAEAAGITQDAAMKVSSAFGSGMRMGSTCGAITGGLMVLGLLGKDDPETTGKFLKVFRDHHDGVTDCATLLKVNHEKGGERKPHCDGMVF